MLNLLEFMIPLRSLIESILAYPYITTFISGFLTEEVLILTTLLSGRGEIPLWAIFVFGFLGIVASDIFWFMFIKIKPLFSFSKKIGEERKKLISKTKLTSLPPPTELKSYIFTKFTFGLRSWGIFYCSVHKMSFRKFLLNTSIATAVYLLIIASLARIVGKGLYLIFDLTKNIGIIILTVFTLLIFWIFIMKFFANRLKKPQ